MLTGDIRNQIDRIWDAEAKRFNLLILRLQLALLRIVTDLRRSLTVAFNHIH
jgi:hypothetical protein